MIVEYEYSILLLESIVTNSSELNLLKLSTVIKSN